MGLCRSEEMKKKGLQIIILLLSIAAGLFIYPIMQKLYGNNWDLVRCMLSISLLMVGSTCINYKVGRYYSCEYRFYKLIGMREHEIIKQFYHKNHMLYAMLMFVFYIISVQNHVVQGMFKTIQFLIILLTITSFLYMIRYSQKAAMAFAVVLYSLLCTLLLCGIVAVIGCCQQGMGILDILWYFRNMAPIAMGYDLLCNQYNCFFSAIHFGVLCLYKK